MSKVRVVLRKPLTANQITLFGREYLTIIYYLLLNADDTAPISKCYRDYIRFAECRLFFFLLCAMDETGYIQLNSLVQTEQNYGQ